MPDRGASRSRTIVGTRRRWVVALVLVDGPGVAIAPGGKSCDRRHYP
ncbi:hypothetical protein [Phormidium sp. CCY1219]|nr:hypothetical protein [Phormidium sp. CCY1219]MEB3829810.1 hypothetical protein [Phormidium sp. CCY1219]